MLVVEDNLEVGGFANQILQDLGYETAWAANAEEALLMVGPTALAFDAVFSDVVMPGMTGVALAGELRRRRAQLPVILASGYSDELAEGGYSAFEFLAKPYSADQLARVLALLERRVRKAGDLLRPVGRRDRAIDQRGFELGFEP